MGAFKATQGPGTASKVNSGAVLAIAEQLECDFFLH